MSDGKASRLRRKVGGGIRVRNEAGFVGVEVWRIEGEGGSCLKERHRDGDE